MEPQVRYVEVQRTGNGMAVASLVIGLVGLLVFGIVLGPLAIIFGGIGLSRGQTQGGSTMATWGLVLGIIDVLAFFAIMASL